MIHFMDEPSRLPNIVPLFRSEAQFRILGHLFTNPGLELPIAELSAACEVPQATTSREVGRLVEAGLLRTRQQGNRTLVSGNLDTSISQDLRNMLMKVFGPVSAVEAAFRDTDAVQVAIFGSWAARWRGDPGPPPNDIDLLVVGDVEYAEVWDRAAELSSRLGLEVNPVIRTVEEWEGEDSGFATAVRTGPLVTVIDREATSP